MLTIHVKFLMGIEDEVLLRQMTDRGRGRTTEARNCAVVIRIENTAGDTSLVVTMNNH